VTGLAGFFACAQLGIGKSPAAATPAAPPTKVLRVIFMISSSFFVAAAVFRRLRTASSCTFRAFEPKGGIKTPNLELRLPDRMP
jgi:hypothetical protein